MTSYTTFQAYRYVITFKMSAENDSEMHDIVRAEQPLSASVATAPEEQDADKQAEWSHKMSACCEDKKTCAAGLFCPCHVVGRNAALLGEGYWTWCIADGLLRLLLADAPCVGHLAVRAKVREKFNIEGTIWKDFAATCFCTPCALVQESRELQQQAQQIERE